MEKLPPRKVAFGKNLPLDLRLNVSNNKTAETWLEWNHLQPGEANFADVYADILNLWLVPYQLYKYSEIMISYILYQKSNSNKSNEVTFIFYCRIFPPSSTQERKLLTAN